MENGDLEATVEALIDLDEPEALLSEVRKAAARKRDPRWKALAGVLAEAETKLMAGQQPKRGSQHGAEKTAEDHGEGGDAAEGEGE